MPDKWLVEVQKRGSSPSVPERMTRLNANTIELVCMLPATEKGIQEIA
jgi:hypothetical protein